MLEMTQAFQVERQRMTQWLEYRIKRGEKEIVTETVTLTPCLAALLLERNEANRKLSDNVAGTYAKDISNNRWLLNGEPIIVSKDGKLNDGQHRCAAVVMSDRAMRVVMVFGVERDSRFTINQGKVRTVGDYVGMHGHPDANHTAAVASYILLWKDKGRLYSGGKERGTKAEILHVAEHYQSSILDSLHVAGRAGNTQVGGKSVVAFCHWAVCRKTKEVEATAFFEQLIDGTELTARDPIMLARRRFAAPGKRLVPNERAELIFRAWNSTRLQERPTRLVVLNGPLPKLER